MTGWGRVAERRLTNRPGRLSRGNTKLRSGYTPLPAAHCLKRVASHFMSCVSSAESISGIAFSVTPFNLTPDR